MTSSHHHEWSLHCHPCTKSRTNMTPSYKTINSITILCVCAWNNSVVIILVGTDGNGHGQQIRCWLTYQALLSFRRTYQHNHMIMKIKKQQQEEKETTASTILQHCTRYGVARRGGGWGGWNGVRVVKRQHHHHHHHHWTISATPPSMYHNQLDSIQLSPTQTIPNSSLVYQPRQRQRAMSFATSWKVLLYHHNNNWWHGWWHGRWQLTPYNLVIITLFVFVSMFVSICFCS